MYVYRLTEPGLWTVGYYDPNGKWEPESDHGDREEAASRVSYLNGGPRNKRVTVQLSDEMFEQMKKDGVLKPGNLLKPGNYDLIP